MALLRTRNSLPEDIRTQIVALCQARLVDAVDLQTQAKEAHWNVRGPHFGPLHELFDEIAGAAGGYADTIAERAGQLGGTVLATARDVAQRSSLGPYPGAAVEGPAHVDAMAAALGTFGAFTRAAIKSALDLGDQVTADVFIEITRGVDAWLWKVEAHQQAGK